ncbi:MAG: hypothetical protein SGI71_11810 [Verrucomicrobiota bacterium]|nr:hypothetical protein [Verrucomicrobiota bacterium]
MSHVFETGVDESKRLGIIIHSIPVKPLAQAKLKCGGFFIALIPARKGHREI